MVLFKKIFSASTLQVIFSTWLQTAIVMRQEEKSYKPFVKLYLRDALLFEQTPSEILSTVKNNMMCISLRGVFWWLHSGIICARNDLQGT